MTPHSHSALKIDDPFLAYPPQKKHPVQPPPAPPSPLSTNLHRVRRRSSTFSAIATWAAQVQPGTPAPHRRPSLTRSRHPSIPSICTPSASLFRIVPASTTAHAITPSIRDFKPDLTSLGYTSVFLQLPKTPISTTLAFSITPPPGAAKHISTPFIPSPTCKPRGFTRFRSLSVLRARSRSKIVSPDSPKMKAKAAAVSAAIVKRKKAKYGMRPPPLANELALMQFIDGGSMDNNIKRVMEAQAQAAGVLGHADVHRDGEGGIWWDHDEELEYAHLLAEGGSRPHVTGDFHWVTFGENTSSSMAGLPAEERRGSVSTQDSDLDPKYVVDPLDEDDLTVFGSAVAPVAISEPAVSVLTIPSRSRRAARHLRKPDILVDAAFSRLHTSPKSPKHSTPSGTRPGMRLKGKARRRPAPLKLFPPSPTFEQATNSPIDADRVRRDFIETSFEPVFSVSHPVTPTTTTVSMSTPVDSRLRLAGGSPAEVDASRQTANDDPTSLGMKRKTSVLNLMGLFRSARKEGVV